jgi:hypothetical protein
VVIVAFVPLCVSLNASSAGADAYDGSDPWGGTGCIYTSLLVKSTPFYDRFGNNLGGNVELKWSAACKTAFTSVAKPSVALNSNSGPRAYVKRYSPSWNTYDAGTMAYNATNAFSRQVHDQGSGTNPYVPQYAFGYAFMFMTPGGQNYYQETAAY